MLDGRNARRRPPGIKDDRYLIGARPMKGKNQVKQSLPVVFQLRRGLSVVDHPQGVEQIVTVDEILHGFIARHAPVRTSSSA